MNDVTGQYRRMADQARIDAASASLPNVRELHLRSAKRLDEIISGLDRLAMAKNENEEAKRAATAT